MLQKLDFEEDGEAAGRGQHFGAASHQGEANQSYLLQPSFYWQLIKRRALYFIVPFILVLVAGLAVAVLLPATYVSEGKILVQSQQIPHECGAGAHPGHRAAHNDAREPARHDRQVSAVPGKTDLDVREPAGRIDAEKHQN